MSVRNRGIAFGEGQIEVVGGNLLDLDARHLIEHQGVRMRPGVKRLTYEVYKVNRVNRK